ncbi:ArsR/SmtB family transcription factor [Streptomyces albogriseolus]|uniref:ArsR/SmtB family transcription factor n=1 Tax=Streptomyces albogriseolus TaxID=1887 RepID=UPI00345F6FBB
MSAPTPSLPLIAPAPGTPALADRPLIDTGQAGRLADLFKVLGNDTRLRLLHAIHRGGEVRAGDLAAAVGMTQQAVSNQLQRLVDKKICATRREGTGIHYRIVDPCVPSLLEYGLCLVETPATAQ